VRESSAIRIIELLRREGADVSYHDPLVPSITVEQQDFASRPLTAAYLASQDAILIVADHDTIDWSLILPHAPIVVDTRNVLAKVLASATSQAARI